MKNTNYFVDALELARLCGTSEHYVRRAIRKKRLPLGPRFDLTAHSVLAFAASNPFPTGKNGRRIVPNGFLDPALLEGNSGSQRGQYGTVNGAHPMVRLCLIRAAGRVLTQEECVRTLDLANTGEK